MSMDDQFVLFFKEFLIGVKGIQWTSMDDQLVILVNEFLIRVKGTNGRAWRTSSFFSSTGS